jgi:hypothetical protein
MPIIAVFSTVLLGAAALAVDLSVQTHRERSLQNVGDSAAMVGALDLTSVPVPQTQRNKAVSDAFAKLHNDLQYPTSGSSNVSNYISSLLGLGQCVGATCTVNCPSTGSICTAELVSGGYDMLVSTPPIHANNPADAVDLNVEVSINQPTGNQLGGFVGQTSGNPGAHSIAYHLPGNQHLAFALVSQTFVQDGNDGEIFSGNVYAGQYLNPQSSGQAFICANGSVVLGAPQAPNAPIGTPTQLNSGPAAISFVNGPNSSAPKTCTSDLPSGGQVAQTNAEGCGFVSGLPSGSYVDDSTFSPAQSVPNGGTLGSTKACVAYPAIQNPVLQKPTLPSPLPIYNGVGSNTGLQGTPPVYQPGEYTYPLNVNYPLAKGVYVILSSGGVGADVTIATPMASQSCSASEQAAGYNVCLDGVTFDLATDATHTTPPTINAGTGAGSVQINQTPYCPSPRLSAGDCVYTVYAAPGVGASVNLTNPWAVWAMVGTAYIPGGTMSSTRNTRFQIDGQAIVNQWLDQSGYHANTSVSFDPNAAAPLPEVLRLAE